MDDFELIKRILSEEKRAWDKFVAEFSNGIYSAITFTFRYYDCPALSEEVADCYQEVFLKLIKENYKVLRSFQARNNCKLSTFLWLVANRVTIDFLRKRKGDVSCNEKNIQIDHHFRECTKKISNDTSEDLVNKLDAESEFERIKKELDEKEKQLLKMMLDKKCSKDAASELGIKVGYYDEKTKRLRKKIKKLLEKDI